MTPSSPPPLRLDEPRTYLTFGGTETYLHFLQGFPLDNMCGFRVLDDDVHYARLEAQYYRPIADAAAAAGHGIVFDALVWRASADHLITAGLSARDVTRLNVLGVQRARQSIADWRQRAGSSAEACPAWVAGDLGPRGDAYARGSGGLTVEVARDYHRPQLEALAAADVDLVMAMTMPSVVEAIGVARAAQEVGLSVVLSPTVETDGRLPDGTPLGECIERVDEATSGGPAFYMVNCVHPSHLRPTLDAAAARGAPWLERWRGIRANASHKTHAELDESPTLDRGDPEELARQVADLATRFGLKVVGGCCGTDAEHLAAIARHTARHRGCAGHPEA